jgi:hypothetical protein
MPLWTELITPAELTGYARASLEAYEARSGSLARWLPNRTVSDIVVRFVAGSTGLVEVANFRAFDAEPEMGRGEGGKRVSIELPALGQDIPVSEYQQLRTRNASDDAILRQIERTTDRVVKAVVNRMEYTRGIVLNTGKATIANSGNFTSEDDYARTAGHTTTAGTLWSTAGVDRLGYLQTLFDLYQDTNGEDPGCILMSTRVFRALQSGSQFQTQLLNGGARNATDDEVRSIISAAGLPEIILYNRRVNIRGLGTTRVLPDDRLLLLPAPVDPFDEEGTDLGGSYWGQTLTASLDGWDIADDEAPGLVTGVYRGDKPPAIAEVISDAIGLPVLTNPNLSLSAKVL